MPFNPSPQNERPFADLRNGLNTALGICRIWAFTLEAFLHKGMGRRYIGLQSMVALPLLLVYSACWQRDDPRPMLVYLVAYIVMLVVCRIGSIAANEQQRHTYYTGWPRLMGRRGRRFELTFKRWIEPLLVLAIGFIARDFNVPLGTYLMIGAVCLYVSVTAWVFEQQVKADDMNDQVLEQTFVAERFREMRGGE